MYGDTGYKTAFDFHAHCLRSNLDLIVDSLEDIEQFVSGYVDRDYQPALRRTLFLYLEHSHECVATCQNLFDKLMLDRMEVTNEE